MALNFKFTQHFLQEWKSYDEKTKRRIENKLRLIKQNPFRYPKHENHRFVFKIKISIEGKYSRLMYAAFMPDKEHITILGIFPRKARYKDFERIFKSLNT